jgi:hypothetical protein
MRGAPVLDHHETPHIEVPAKPTPRSVGRARRAGAFVLHEFREMLPPTIFFFIGFNLIVLTTNLLLADYDAQFSSFMLTTAAALVVGKAVLVANAMRSIRHYDRAPLIRPILFKTVFYWAVVFVARLLEHFIKFWLVEHHPLGSFVPHMIATFSWDRFIAIQLWIFVLFLIYVDGYRAQSFVRRGRAVAHPAHQPTVGIAAEPAATDPRARPAKQACRCPLGR